MFKVPDACLEKLKCNICDGYVNAWPVVVQNNRQICAKCYAILPKDERDQCVRQISFEAIASCLIFPCRYHKMGCQHTFTWNNENGHEAECKKRYFTYPDLITVNKIPPDECVTPDKSLSASSESGKVEPILSVAKTLTNLNFFDGKSNPAFKNDLVDEAQNAINLNIEGSALYHSPRLRRHPQPEIILSTEHNNNNVVVPSVYENIYSTIVPTVSNIKSTCLNCQSEVEKHNKNTCIFGHVTCANCKGDMCIVCVKNLDGTSRIACKNASRGCDRILLQEDVGFHRDNCEFNEISCPFDKCDKKDILERLKDHLKEVHSNTITESNEFQKIMSYRDQTLVLLCYEGIFKCLYFYYATSVEIFVVYLGPCAKASEFAFEVTVDVNKKPVKKKLVCANWNNCMLASGVNFDTKDLVKPGEKKFKFDLHLRIFLVK